MVHREINPVKENQFDAQLILSIFRDYFQVSTVHHYY